MSVQVIDTLKPKNNGTFPVVEAEDVAVSDELRLPEALNAKAEQSDLEELSSALEEKADISTTDSLQTQINEIAQAAGTGSADTEVAQARVDANGTSYSTLKDRLDYSDSEITSTQKEIFDFIINDNSYVNKNNGVKTTHADYFSTDFISLSFDVFVKTKVNDDAAGICFYTKDKTFISGYNPYSDNETEVKLTKPTGAYYVKITCLNSYSNNFICRYNDALPVISENLNQLNSSSADLTAEVGSIDAELYGGDANIPSSLIEEGYYVNNVQRNLTAHAGYHYTDLIELKQGETIKVVNGNTTSANVVDMISTWTSEGIYLQSIVAYTSTSPESGQYTAVNPVEYVRVCSYGIPTITKSTDGLKIEVANAVGELDKIKDNAISYDYDDADVEIIDGRFINMDGNIPINENYSYTSNYALYKGETVYVTSKDPATTNVSLISLWTVDNRYIRTVEYGQATLTTVTYTATEPIEYVRFSFPTAGPIAIKVNKIVVPTVFRDTVNLLIDDKIVPFYNIDYSISMFESVAFCGDSYVKGQLYDSNGLIGDRPYLSWGANLGRTKGVEAHIYASSGADTNTWQSRASCLPLALSDSPCGLYIFCLGINDSYLVTTGTIDDIHEDYTDNPNTFYGNYGRIIAQIQEHAPSSKIIIMTPFNPSYNQQYVTPVTEITEHFGIAMIDTSQSLLCNDYRFSNLMISGHPTAALHSAMANDIEKLIRDCIKNNYDYFKDYAGVQS